MFPRLLWSQCECRVKNAMRGQSRGRYRGEFYYEYKAVFYCRPMPEQRKIPSPLRIQISGKGERVLTRSTGRSFPQNQFEGRPKTPPSTDRFRHLGTNFQTWNGRGREQKKWGEVFTLESGTTPTTPTTRLHIHRERREREGVNRNPYPLSPLCLPALSFL